LLTTFLFQPLNDVAALDRDLSKYILSSADWDGIEEIADLMKVSFLPFSIKSI